MLKGFRDFLLRGGTAAPTKEEVLLAEIRDLLRQQRG
jgi:large-conductance mechanosensitive channel